MYHLESLAYRPVLEKIQDKIAQYTYMYVAPTGVYGLGMFTARAVDANETVLHVHDASYYASARRYRHVRLLGFTPGEIFQVGRDLFIPPYGGIDDFTNHSCEPNCGLRVDSSGFDMIALRDIAAGEEVTYDYSTHQEHPEEDMTCLCGAASCRGFIRSFSTLPAALRQRYLDLGVVAAFIAETNGSPA